MNGKVLSQIATETNGAYIPAGTKRVNMADVYHGYVANVEQTEFETAKINAYIARFQWFALPALALLLLEVVISTRTPRLTPSRNDRIWNPHPGHVPLGVKHSNDTSTTDQPLEQQAA